MNNQSNVDVAMKAQSKDAYQSNGLPSEIQELQQCIQDMQHAFALLHEKISPVCRPDSPNACGVSSASVNAPTPSLSPVEERVRMAYQELNSIRVAMLQLHGRIAL